MPFNTFHQQRRKAVGIYKVKNITAYSTQSSFLGATTMTSNNQPHDEQWLFWVRIVIIIILLFFTVIGNLMVLYCLFNIKELQTITGVFLTNLAATDLGVGLVNLPLALASGIEQSLVHLRWFCNLQGMAMVLFVIASLLTLGVLSIIKYFNVGYSVQKRFKKRHARYSIVGIWVVATIFALIPAFGFSKYDYGTGGRHCAPYENSVEGYVYATILLTTGFVLPSIAMLYCYCKLYAMTYTHIRRVRVSDISTANNSQRCLTSVESHMVNTLIIMVIAFIICWLPALIFYVLNFTHILFSSTFDTIVMLCVYANSAVNPILYAMRQQDFRRGFRHIIRRLFNQH